MKSLQDIKSILELHKPHLFKDYSIQSLAIFGSWSRKEQNNESDLDLLVEFHDKIGIRFIDLAEEIESLIGCKIDLVSRNGIKDKYEQSINSELIYV